MTSVWRSGLLSLGNYRYDGPTTSRFIDVCEFYSNPNAEMVDPELIAWTYYLARKCRHATFAKQFIQELQQDGERASQIVGFFLAALAVHYTNGALVGFRKRFLGLLEPDEEDCTEPNQVQDALPKQAVNRPIRVPFDEVPVGASFRRRNDNSALRKVGLNTVESGFVRMDVLYSEMVEIVSAPADREVAITSSNTSASISTDDLRQDASGVALKQSPISDRSPLLKRRLMSEGYRFQSFGRGGQNEIVITPQGEQIRIYSKFDLEKLLHNLEASSSPYSTRGRHSENDR